MKPAPDRDTDLAPSLAAALEGLLGRHPSGEEFEGARLRLQMIVETLRTIAARLERKNP